ncbi:Serine/threonine protein kinase [Trema orientale]|uniref:non-specific serine/threonine protein kinase n=1 Tax=Trema orientale TaxID=63057 RepID=A0A2P5F5K8_TREOI|nr:Serine/threonine protein kinase [Trema orientale]
MASDLNQGLSRKTFLFGLRVWELTAIVVAVFIILFLLVLSICLSSRKRSRRRAKSSLPFIQIPNVSREIKEIRVDQVAANNNHANFLSLDKFSDKELEKVLINTKMADNSSQSGSFTNIDKEGGMGSQSGEDGGLHMVSVHNPSSHPISAPSPLSGLPEFSHLGWGHWFTLRDLEVATKRFSNENVIGEGGYGVVYRGNLINGSPVAVKKLLNNLGQAEKEFRVEVEAIGHVRHKNLVRLLGYCIEGTHRLLVYEYVNNGNLEQWLHGAMSHHGYLTWEARMKVLLGTAKALAYLHEAIEPKVVHRDIKSSNILLDDEFNAKISDFGLAKLLGAGKSHITTRVNLVDWLKMMVGNRRSEEVVDPKIENRPSTSDLKRALLTALRCLDPDADRRPKMGQVVRMLESEEYPIPREGRRRRKSKAGNTLAEFQTENSDTDKSDNPDTRPAGKNNGK